MHFLVMSPYSCDLIVMSLVVKLIGTWFSDSELSTCLSYLRMQHYSETIHYNDVKGLQKA